MFQFILFLSLFMVPFTVRAQTVYLKPTEALKTIFASSTDITTDKKQLTGEQKQIIEKKLGARLERDVWNFYIARTGSKVDGYAVVDNEVGKTEPITFLTAISPQGMVRDVEVLVYRESYGSEVHEAGFLKQFKDKKDSDPVRTGQDIKIITGATLSSGAIARGVKRALVIWEVCYGK